MRGAARVHWTAARGHARAPGSCSSRWRGGCSRCDPPPSRLPLPPRGAHAGSGGWVASTQGWSTQAGTRSREVQGTLNASAAAPRQGSVLLLSRRSALPPPAATTGSRPRRRGSWSNRGARPRPARARARSSARGRGRRRGPWAALHPPGRKSAHLASPPAAGPPPQRPRAATWPRRQAGGRGLLHRRGRCASPSLVAVGGASRSKPAACPRRGRRPAGRGGRARLSAGGGRGGCRAPAAPAA